jgi:hypothetical protein
MITTAVLLTRRMPGTVQKAKQIHIRIQLFPLALEPVLVATVGRKRVLMGPGSNLCLIRLTFLMHTDKARIKQMQET